jgi:TraK protein
VKRIFAFAVMCFFALAPNALQAEQRLSIHADKKAVFYAAAGGVTRISVVGDRIRKLIHDASSFETMNDEETGDVFMRYVGDQAKLAPETGHIITESGVTIAYEITPRVSTDAETVVIEVTGGAKKAAASGATVTPAAASEAPPFLDAAADQGGGHSDGLVEFTRKVIVEHIGRKAPPKVGNGATVASEKSGGLRARVLVAKVGASGGYVRPQSYYNAKVVAVWVDHASLGPNERTWVVVVERAK